nr:hypothetical protein [Tanacetum cinerariifolium]
MSVPASPEHVPDIPDQLPVELPLAINLLEVDNDYLDAIDYDDEDEPYEDLDDQEEDPEEDPKMDLDEEERDPKKDVNDEEEEEPLLVRPFKGLLSTYEGGEPSSVASALVFSTIYELNQLRQDFGILGNRVQSLTRAMDRDRIGKTQDQDGKQIWELRHRLTSAKIRLEVASVDWGFKENRLIESIDVLVTYGDADPPELQEPSDMQ